MDDNRMSPGEPSPGLPAVYCQDADFARALCRIAVEETPDPLGGTRFVATVAVLDKETQVPTPLVFEDGARLSFPAATRELALNSALAYLDGRFGPFSEIMHGCDSP